MQKAQLFVKFVQNKKLNTVKILCAFNVYKNSEGVYAFPTQKQCAYVSGDVLAQDVANTLVRISAKQNATLVVTN